MINDDVVITENINNPEIEGAKPKPKPKAAAKKPAVKKAPASKAAAKKDDRVMLFMRHGAGYAVGDVKFLSSHPYQLVDSETAKQLLQTEQFEEADAEAVKEFYGE